MTDYVDFDLTDESTWKIFSDGLPSQYLFESLPQDFDLAVVGCGAAGLTLARELSGRGLRIVLIESGALQEDEAHEELNEVEVSGRLEQPLYQEARSKVHASQLRFWKPNIQRFGVRCRVFGGSTAGWAGKVAPFDPLDYENRPWVPFSGWPITCGILEPYMARAAEHLDLGPLLDGKTFWQKTPYREPRELTGMRAFSSFFWQMARSRHVLTDVMRFGPDFRTEHHEGVTVLYNATVQKALISHGRVTGVELCSSLSADRRMTLKARHVVLAASAIENARLLLLSDGSQSELEKVRNSLGRYLTDHPCFSLGAFAPETREKVMNLIGYRSVLQNFRGFMYIHGLALKPEVQRERALPNMAAYVSEFFSENDPWAAFKRLVRGRSRSPFTDIRTIVENSTLIITQIGRKTLASPRVPLRLRRLLTDATILMNAKFVTRDYIGGGRGRKFETVELHVIFEQPPHPDNRVTLSEKTDRLGVRRAAVSWNVDQTLRREILDYAALLKEDLERAGITRFQLREELAFGDISRLPIVDMGHTAGTTRMGADPATSVVDSDCQVHGVSGLYVAGGSILPTIGHANPTMVIMALTIRLADHLADKIMTWNIESMLAPSTDESSALVAVTGATGNLGREVVSLLLAHGYRVRGQFRKSMPIQEGVEWVKLDFSDPELSVGSLRAFAHGAKAVIHLAASTSKPEEMQAANVTNLARFAQACADCGVRYFGQASSMVVYGSPRERMITETSPRIDLEKPVHKQYFAEPVLREYARTKRIGEDILSEFSNAMHIDLYRIAVAQPERFMRDSLTWGWKRQLFALYRNSHFMTSHDTARAIVHLMEHGMVQALQGIEAYNVSNRNSPTYAEFYEQSGRRVGIHVPLLFDVLKNWKVARGISNRRPMGAFRMDDAKLRRTGFEASSVG